MDLPSRYQVVARLGAGAMGEVWRVFDRERGEQVALKRLVGRAGANDAEAAALFRREFWTMASLRHPHLVEAHDFGEARDGMPYFTMALVEGREAAAPMTEAAVRGWLPGVAAALAFLHAQGVVHGDVKPENLRIGADGRATLMDLGLLAPAGRAGGPARGTPAYMAPEAFAGGAVDGRADLYALGATLYHLLAGRPPFAAGDDMLSLVRAHRDVPAPPLRESAPDVSLAMAEAVARLLAKDPAARFRDAGELLGALGLAAKGLPAGGLLGSPLVGMGEARAALARTIAGEGAAPGRGGATGDGGVTADGGARVAGGVVALRGPAGAGKTRLLGEALAAAQLAGLPTVAIAGLGQDAAPYAAARPLLVALLAAAPPIARAAAAAVVARVAPEVAQAAAPASPEGASPAAAAALDGPAERLRLLAAVAELALAALPGPAVWVVDEADRLDAASAGLVAHLRATGGGRAWRWWLAAEAFDADPGVPPLALPPLEAAETMALAGALLGATPPPAVGERLVAAAGGRPGAIEALLRRWVATRALRREAAGWVAPAPEALDVPAGGATPLDAGGLPPEIAPVARVAALLGPGASLPWLAAAADVPPEQAFAAVDALEAAGLVTRSGAAFAFTREGPAAALAAAMRSEEAQAAHRRAARWFVSRPGTGPDESPLAEAFAAARHHLASDEPAQGVPWAIGAASRALALHAPGPSEPLVRRALEVAAADGGEALRLELLLATLARFDGRVDEALALHERLAPKLGALPPAQRARATTTHGMLLQQKGRYAEAAAAYAAAEPLALTADDDGEVDAFEAARAAFMAARVAYFTGDATAAEAHLARARAAVADPAAASLVAPVLSFAGYVVVSRDPGRLAEGLAAIEAALAAADALGDPLAGHEARNNQGNLLLTVGRYAEARGAFDACEALATRMGTSNELIFARLNAGAARLELGDLGVAAAKLEGALALARAQARRFPEALALAYLGLVRVHADAPAAGAALLDEGVAIAAAIGNAYAEALARALRAEGRLALGRLAEAEADVAAVRGLAEASGAKEQAAKADMVEAAIGAMRGEPGAAARLDALAGEARTAGRDDMLARALRVRVDGLVRAGEAAAARPLLPEALMAAARAGTRLVEGELAWLAGRAAADSAEAAAHFARAAELGAETGAALLTALGMAGDGQDVQAARRARAAVRQLLAGLDPAGRAAYMRYPERAALLAGAAEAAADGVPPARLALLAELVADAAMRPDLEGVLVASVAALVDLAGMERGFLLLYEEMEVTHKVYYGMVSADADEHSTGLAQRVAWSARPVFVADVGADAGLAARESVQALALRAAIGMPLLAPGADGVEAVVGVMLADSRRAVTDFGPAELAAAEALARLVAGLVVAARRHERYRRGYEEAERLLALATDLLGLPDAEARWAALAAEALAVSGAERCVVLLGEDLVPLRAFGVDGAATDAGAVSRSVAGWAWSAGEPLQLLDAQADEAFVAGGSVATLGLRTVFAVPIGRGDARRGVLYLDSRAVLDPPATALHTLARIGELAARLP